MNILNIFADLVLPKARCLGCDEPRKLEPGACLCENCRAELETLRISDKACPLCLSPMKVGQPCQYCAQGGMAGIERAFAPYKYHDLAQKLVVELKFGPVEQAAQPLSREMALCISGVRFDALVPVPLYISHERERGMNQSRILSEQVSELTGIPVLDALKKVKNTRRQSSLGAKERGDNVKDAFLCVVDVKGKELLLVDDVRTTGHTARECAKQLREQGAASVCLLTATVAGKGGLNGTESV